MGGKFSERDFTLGRFFTEYQFNFLTDVNECEKPTLVTSMHFAPTSYRDHTVAIANKDSLVMDSIAWIRKQTKNDVF